MLQYLTPDEFIRTHIGVRKMYWEGVVTFYNLELMIINDNNDNK